MDQWTRGEIRSDGPVTFVGIPSLEGLLPLQAEVLTFNKLVMLLGQPNRPPMFRQRRCPAGCISLLCQLVRVTKLFTVAPNICGASEWTLLLVTLLVPGGFRWLVEFWKVRVALLCSVPSRHGSAVFLYEVMWSMCLRIPKTAILTLTVQNDLKGW